MSGRVLSDMCMGGQLLIVFNVCMGEGSQILIRSRGPARRRRCFKIDLYLCVFLASEYLYLKNLKLEYFDCSGCYRCRFFNEVGAVISL